MGRLFGGSVHTTMPFGFFQGCFSRASKERIDISAAVLRTPIVIVWYSETGKLYNIKEYIT